MRRICVADAPRGFQTIDDGHMHIHEDDVIYPLLELLQRMLLLEEIAVLYSSLWRLRYAIATVYGSASA